MEEELISEEELMDGDAEEYWDELLDWAENFAGEQADLEPEIKNLLADNLWDLYG